MIIDAIFQPNRMAMDFERTRIEAAALNIAESNTPLAPNQSARRHVAAPLAFSELLPISVGGAAQIESEDAPTRKVLDPNHPLADADGNVRYPDTDLVGQMTSLISASRGYEANVRAFNLLRNMVMRSLEIGR